MAAMLLGFAQKLSSRARMHGRGAPKRALLPTMKMSERAIFLDEKMHPQEAAAMLLAAFGLIVGLYSLNVAAKEY